MSKRSLQEHGVSGRRSRSKRDQISYDPFKGPPVTLFIKASTLWTVWPSVLAFTLEALIIALLNRPKYDHHHGAGTSSAYAQYTEARKAWGNVIHHSRALARMIWIHVPDTLSPSDKGSPTNTEINHAILEKKTMINMIEAFSVSLKHHLRGEYGIFHEDLYHFVCFLPKYTSPPYSQPLQASLEKLNKTSSPLASSSGDDGHTDNQSMYSQNSKDGSTIINFPDPLNPPRKLLPSYNPRRKSICDYLPFLRIFRSLWKGTLNITKLRKLSSPVDGSCDNIPLEILWQLDAYITSLRQRKLTDVPTTNSCNAAVLGLADALSTLERVLTTPLPFGYSVHLKTIIWGYLLFLPFQLIGTFRRITVPATCLISFVFLGFMELSEDIENPFGYSSNDLDMDHFCFNIIAKEIDELTSQTQVDPHEYVFAKSNLPLLSYGECRMTEELCKLMTPQEMRKLISRKGKDSRFIYSKF
ncbi:hypothetical protein CROQUDRAFT_69908 [Cronartium quercuum f. sp. fusiforme G11]|uniref:Uncharacterized protein n=1 Tax=Cronartium quercuum f. sp. fusiforme G11 TaxID=708437 RepID=A0A9P6N9L3_9BASI|nr:hypothetical protein CROQUDRAFT_69908 [Cronartium quercuum f. sp. fusiforme G11]